MAGHNKNYYRFLAIEEYTRTLRTGQRFHIRDCCDFLNNKKAKGSNRIHKQTQTHNNQLAMLLKRTSYFTSLGNGVWVFKGGIK